MLQENWHVVFDFSLLVFPLRLAAFFFVNGLCCSVVGKDSRNDKSTAVVSSSSSSYVG